MKKSRPLPGARARDAAGFTLIEVMVALIVLILGVLGAAAMTLNAIRDGKQSGLRSQASALAYEIGDLMRMSPGEEGVFTGAPPSKVASCWTTGCSPADMASNNYYEWRRKLTATSTGLPNAAAVICRDATQLDQYPACDGLATSPIVVKMKWDEKKNDGKFDTTVSGAADPLAGPRLVVPLQR